MVQVNFARREVNCKLVFYGCGMCGKTTNLQVIHDKAPKDRVGSLTSIATEQDRTLFFDFMPLDLGTIAGMKTKFFLYTVPGQVFYASTRKLVLQGVDGIMLVVDSGADRLNDNIESLKDLETNLKEYGLSSEKLPLVFQWNKRDLPNAMPVEELARVLNPRGLPAFEAVAFKGEGVMQTLKGLAGLVIERLNQEYGQKSPSTVPSTPTPTTPTVPVSKPTAPPPPPAPPKPVVPPPPRPVAPPPPPPRPVQLPPSPPPPPKPVLPIPPKPYVPPAPAPAAAKKSGCKGLTAVLAAILIMAGALAASALLWAF